MTIYTGFDWYRDGHTTFTDVNWFGASSIPLTGIQLRAAQDVYEQKTDKISWAAVKNQYFATIVAVDQGDPGTAVWARKIDLLHGGDQAQPVLGLEGALEVLGLRAVGDPARRRRDGLHPGHGRVELGREIAPHRASLRLRLGPPTTRAASRARR